MSIEMKNPQTLVEKLDAASNLVAQLKLSHDVGDKPHFARTYEKAIKLVMDALDAVQQGTPAEQLAALRNRLGETNPHTYCEVAFTRQTEWMAWLCDKSPDPGTGRPLPNRIVLARGQGESMNAACFNCLLDHWKRWWRELLSVAQLKNWPVEEGGEEAWRDYYTDGYSPVDAIREDMSHGTD